MQRLTIDIVSDVTCPWCIIGYQSLKLALQQLEKELAATLSWHPFEINPQVGKQGQIKRENLQQKYGLSDEQIAQNFDNITKRANELGFDMRLDKQSHTYNTFDAHRLLHWAKLQGQDTALKMALFTLYFTDGGNPSDHQALLQQVDQLGLDVDAAKQILASDSYAEEVRADISHYQQLGITSVPTFVINGKYGISGGQPVESFVEGLRNLALKERGNSGK
ncbi:DsbA family oxidoreductase [Ferrimonas lipolytica]|uniref:DsbA family oxidoreductase n=1 Tax=Ferrimonas lipolytica TaxID=2724191 RepID=A0A6H1UEH2_9GAMM|nr:DsbA family oxidoreductase [Ferrimonas lipolytica]QIZ76192.1 DsbA family oxidoreductase [Ferrimonas lipolytica]